MCHTVCGILARQRQIQPATPALGVWGLNPWTSREILKEFWSKHSKFSIGLIRMLFIHFLNTKYKRIPFLSWIPYLKQKEKAIKDNLSQAL